MRRIKRITSLFALLLVVSFLVESVNAEAVAGGSNYTYTYDCWYEDRESPDSYAVNRTITGSDFKECGNFKNPEGLYSVGNDVYVVDTGNNRVVRLNYNNDEFKCVQVIKEFNNNGQKDTLSGPKDIFVTEQGEIYIADTGHNRIVHLDQNLNVIKIITRPVDDTVDQNNEFLPVKLVVDSSNRIFANVQNVNKGFMEFASDGSFTGYVGASEVTYDVFTYLWKLIATKEQRSQMILFVPTEYSNLCLDSEGFIYGTISVFEGTPENAKPVRKLNAKGTDILIRNSLVKPIGDIYYAEKGELSGPSKFLDVCAMPNDTYFCLDNTRGRIFGYDFQGNMLYAFGGHGYREGYFINPVALEDIGDSLLVLDKDLGTITQMTLTEYGTLINQGLAEYKRGDYDASADTWRKVLRLNGNYDLGYIGVGRSLLRKEKYEEAMYYFETKLDKENYSKAYKLYRKEQMEDNITYVLIVLAVIIVLCFGVSFIKKARKEVEKG